MRNFFLSEQFAYQSRRAAYAEKAGQSAGCRAGKPRGAGTGFGLTRRDPDQRGRVRVGGPGRTGLPGYGGAGRTASPISGRRYLLFRSASVMFFKAESWSARRLFPKWFVRSSGKRSYLYIVYFILLYTIYRNYNLTIYYCKINYKAKKLKKKTYLFNFFNFL